MRMLAGLGKFGKYDPEKDPRDMKFEALEEIADYLDRVVREEVKA